MKQLTFIFLMTAFLFTAFGQKMTPIKISNVDSIKVIPNFHDDTISEPPIKFDHHNNMETFSENWKADSLGKDNFRNNSLINDTLAINLKSLKKEQVLELLGHPNKTKQDNLMLVFDYFLTPHCGFSEEGCYRYSLEIVFENDIEVKYYITFIETK